MHPRYASSSHLAALGLPPSDAYDLPPSPRRFPDGAQVRIEIPSVEGPAAMRTVLDTARELSVPVHRVSQGSGIWLLSDDELDEMVALGREHRVEVVLFVGPRAGWGTGVHAASPSGALLAGALRGADELAAGTDDVLRAAEHGVDGVLVADLGHLAVLGRLKREGTLPADFQLKVSVLLPVANPATAELLEQLGATCLNLPVDLSLPAIAAIRQAVSIPIDVYVESADEHGGGLRHYEIPGLVSVGAPIHLKFTVRNAPGTYPSGRHLQPLVESLAVERVRRAGLGLALLRRYLPDATISPASMGTAA